MATLIRTDRNGTKYYEGMVTCDRCGGRGWYAVGVHNGQLIPARPDNAICYQCRGAGKIKSKWVERTPEYQAKLDAKRQAKLDAIAAEQKRIAEEKAAKERAEEEARKAQKAISQYVGKVGERITTEATFGYGADWDTFYGRQYLFSFKDNNGNVLVWKTTSIPMVLNAEGKDVTIERGDKVIIRGTVKEHKEYKEEKQTVLTRCKLGV